MVLGLDYTFYITSITDLGSDVYRLYSCDTLHTRVGKSVVIDGNSYEITTVVTNQYIEVTGTDSLDTTVASFQTDILNFFNGSLSDTNIDRKLAKQQQLEQVPFFWNRAPFEYEKNDTSEGDNVEKTASLVWYLLDVSRPFGSGDGANSAWLDTEFHVNCITPLENLLENRIEKYIRDNEQIFGDFGSYRVRPLPHVGQEDDKGTYQALFDEHLSGIEVRIDLPFMYQGCNC